MSNDYITFNNIINSTFSSIENAQLEKNNKLYEVWRKVITSITKVGQNLYEHSSVCELKNGILLVEADHPGWIQMLQMNSDYIVRGLKMYASELKICSLAFKLKGKNVTLYKTDYDEELKKEREKYKLKLEKEEEEINKFYKNEEKIEKNSELPQELLDKFDSLMKKCVDQ